MPFRTAISCLALVVCALATTASGSSMRRLARYKPYCYVENGFDYEGNDIKNVPSVPVEQCCSECNKVDNCNFWSWSDFNNGTCWLKSARGRIIVNANVKSSPLYEGYHTMCEVAQDVDFVGNDIANVPSASVDGCCDLCHNHLGCRAYSWSNHRDGTCWLKSSKGQAIVAKGIKSAQAYPMPVYEPVCALINGVDYPGYDVANARSPSPTGCCALCSKMTNCRLFSWTNQNGGTCYFKSRTPRAVPRAGVISSIMVTNPTCNVESGVDYVGNDIANVPSTDPARCCDFCYENPDCKAYTWSDHQSGTCWLKSAMTATVANAKTTSGTTVQ